MNFHSILIKKMGRVMCYDRAEVSLKPKSDWIFSAGSGIKMQFLSSKKIKVRPMLWNNIKYYFVKKSQKKADRARHSPVTNTPPGSGQLQTMQGSSTRDHDSLVRPLHSNPLLRPMFSGCRVLLGRVLLYSGYSVLLCRVLLYAIATKHWPQVRPWQHRSASAASALITSLSTLWRQNFAYCPSQLLGMIQLVIKGWKVKLFQNHGFPATGSNVGPGS